jgi:hypothetical protein
MSATEHPGALPNEARPAADQVIEEEVMIRREEKAQKYADTMDALSLATAEQQNAPDATKSEMTQKQTMDALEWFLMPEDETDLTHTFEINVGGVGDANEVWIKWTVMPVDMDKLRRIRRAAQPKKARRGQPQGEGDFDGTNANIQVIIEGTQSPDLRAAARELGSVSAEPIVKARFRHKPGLIDQIANEIMAVSGYDDEDIQEIAAAQG